MKHRNRNTASFLTVMFICLLSAGCDDFMKNPAFEARPSPTDYVCNDEQLKLVEKEVSICSRTGYLSDYCFAQAKATLCDKIQVAKSR